MWDPYCTQLLSEGNNHSIVTSLPVTYRVQKFWITRSESYWSCMFVMGRIDLERSDTDSSKQEISVNRAKKDHSGALWRCQTCTTIGSAFHCKIPPPSLENSYVAMLFFIFHESVAIFPSSLLLYMRG